MLQVGSLIVVLGVCGGSCDGIAFVFVDPAILRDLGVHQRLESCFLVELFQSLSGGKLDQVEVREKTLPSLDQIEVGIWTLAELRKLTK